MDAKALLNWRESLIRDKGGAFRSICEKCFRTERLAYYVRI